MHTFTPLEIKRQQHKCPLPSILENLSLSFSKGNYTSSVKDTEELKKLFPHTFGKPVVNAKEGPKRAGKPLKVGVVLSGGQASGGHNVIAGLFDALQRLHPESKLIGFLGGPGGIVKNNHVEITLEKIKPFRNMGGFDLIGSGREKIETDEQLKSSLQSMQSLKLDGLVIIGGDDSNTNAAVLAEYFISQGCHTKVIGVPKTIDGDLKNEHVAVSFGFDTACKVYSEMIGNIARDALSAKKYTHFIKLMGRSASHITLECALATHPNIAIIGEEVAEKKMTLREITRYICDVIIERSSKGKDYGVVILPEGLIEFIPEIAILIKELNALAVSHPNVKAVEIITLLKEEAKNCFLSLPEEIRKQLLLDRDAHGNVQVSLIQTELLLIAKVSEELKERGFTGKFSPQGHFFGYEGRAGFPSNFDAHYCYALGFTAALLIDEGLSGYMCFVENLTAKVNEWKIGGMPITMLMNLESRKGKLKPVIQKALVDLKGIAYKAFDKERRRWALEDAYRFPGPIQFWGDVEITDSLPMSMLK